MRNFQSTAVYKRIALYSRFTTFCRVRAACQEQGFAVFPQNIMRNVAAVHAAYAEKTINMSVQQFLTLANKNNVF
ncbi:hypothetical protein AGNV_026 [Anticarsia gemmatalis nucleopolyhedrovirus]|uniref:Uncharacterized protein n=1 Tax=Anticarsia gemmatalis multiple nucleopolyhedrovirus TaxID=268591 RepID=Q06KD7_9ABAC|nr:hypothetical protein AGNV_026 [Anticarsia gemmatalis nucleopolyhedrovirus]ABI13914.1 hypothetical protein AGNV_026 [Anticarsia gemmatalis multiple nucleopolyhedrovirus]